MTVLDKLATSLGRRDEVPNQDLAEAIVRTGDKQAVAELIEHLGDKNKNIHSDCIKVLYEIGERKPSLIAGYHEVFGRLLDSRNNRLVWGAMTALDAITAEAPEGVFRLLAKIVACAETGSVITRDHAVGILTKLGRLEAYAKKCLPLLLQQLKTCPTNQLPMYAEKSLAVATEKNRKALQEVLTARIEELPKESQQKRVLKVLKQLSVASGGR